MNQTLGLYIGRFQPFHNGHKSVIDRMIEENENNLILIGVNHIYKTKENPYSYAERLQFIGDTYKNTGDISICPLIDNDSDKSWVEQILGIGYIQKSDYIKLYCGSEKDDSAIKVIKQYEKLFLGKKLEIIEVDRNILPISATQVRHEMKVEGVDSIHSLVPSEVLTALKKTG